MKKYYIKFKPGIIYILSLITISLILTLFEYIGVSYTICTLLLNLSNFILVFNYAYMDAKKVSLKGYKSGIKSTVKIWVILLLINILTIHLLSIKTVLFYFIILVIAIFGGIISKNKKLS